MSNMESKLNDRAKLDFNNGILNDFSISTSVLSVRMSSCVQTCTLIVYLRVLLNVYSYLIFSLDNQMHYISIPRMNDYYKFSWRG